jgi:hypothetical protein
LSALRQSALGGLGRATSSIKPQVGVRARRATAHLPGLVDRGPLPHLAGPQIDPAAAVDRDAFGTVEVLSDTIQPFPSLSGIYDTALKALRMEITEIPPPVRPMNAQVASFSD